MKETTRKEVNKKRTKLRTQLIRKVRTEKSSLTRQQLIPKERIHKRHRRLEHLLESTYSKGKSMQRIRNTLMQKKHNEAHMISLGLHKHGRGGTPKKKENKIHSDDSYETESTVSEDDIAYRSRTASSHEQKEKFRNSEKQKNIGKKLGEKTEQEKLKVSAHIVK